MFHNIYRRIQEFMKRLARHGFYLRLAAAFALCQVQFANGQASNANHEVNSHPIMNKIATKIAELPERAGIASPALSFSPDGSRIAVRSADNTITIWDWKKQNVVATLNLPQGANDSRTSKAFQFSPDGNYLAACHSSLPNHGAITVWDTSNWKMVSEIGAHAGGSGCTALAFSPDGKHLIRLLQRFQHQPGNTLEVYQAGSWQLIDGIRTNPLQSAILAVSPDGGRLAVGGHLIPLGGVDIKTDDNPFNNIGDEDDSYITILDVKKFALLSKYKSKVGVSIFSRLAWSADGARVTHSAGHGIETFDPVSGREVSTTPAATAVGVTDVAYPRNGKYFIEAHGPKVNELRIWDVERKQNIQSAKGEFSALDVSADSRYFAVAEPGKTTIWRLN